MVTPHRTLSWRADCQLYELDDQGKKQFFSRTGDAEQWTAWLESIREIAHRLVLSPGTVKKYVRTICGKLGVQSRTQALVRAQTLGLL
jgi:DNA-binding CsgD family transcriptional regulator